MQQSTASLYFAWRTTSLRVGGLAFWALPARPLRPPNALRRRPDTERTCLARGRADSIRTRHDKTVLSVSCLAWRCELDNCYWRAQTSDFLSATVLSCRECTSHRRGRRNTRRTFLSGLAWRYELDATLHARLHGLTGVGGEPRLTIASSSSTPLRLLSLLRKLRWNFHRVWLSTALTGKILQSVVSVRLFPL